MSDAPVCAEGIITVGEREIACRRVSSGTGTSIKLLVEVKIEKGRREEEAGA